MRLTNREVQVLRLISNELTYTEIAKQLCVSQNTIISHRKNIKHKLGVKNSAGIVREGYCRGYLELCMK